MSTFDGYVAEFPLIRIDSFRTLPGRAPPFACFLSHVHSDHLAGLESLKSPFVYCSSATRELLLRLEKYPHRVNHAKGILERRIQSYRHLRKILKPLPLDTPTKIVLCPGNEIQVTLFDANHCLGAAMFLIEGQNNAILYTGDIRSEPWWINSLVQNPIIIPYTIGLRRLNKIYLDTTFGVKSEPYREFQSKAEGIQELLRKVSVYPADTVFYFRSWTFGYENVWLALSQFLKSRIHLDPYRYRLYTSVGATKDLGFTASEVPVLAGFNCGNLRQDPILTKNTGARIHSCETGSQCPALSSNHKVVEITPIVSRHNGIEVRELGAGGGKGDLNQIPELDVRDQSTVKHLLDMCNGQKGNANVSAMTSETIRAGISSNVPRLELPRAILSADEIKLRDLPSVISCLSEPSTDSVSVCQPQAGLSTSITFPYSRHSSYTELRALVSALKPVDIWPCTIPPAEEWKEDLSMETLFGDLCNNPSRNFASDRVMRAKREQALATASLKRKRAVAQETQSDENESPSDGGYSPVVAHAIALGGNGDAASTTDDNSDGQDLDTARKTASAYGPGNHVLSSSQRARLQARREAFRAASTGAWQEINLVSVRSDESDEEL